MTEIITEVLTEDTLNRVIETLTNLVTDGYAVSIRLH